MIRFWIFALIIGLYQNSSAEQCTSPGKYAQDQPGNCEGYALCLMAGAGNFAQYNLTCPPGFIYNHVQSQCTNDTSYQCVPDFTCLENGHFANPFHENCTTFIACVKGLNDVMTARSIVCPRDHIFNSIVGFCEKSNETVYTCFKEQSSNIESILVNLLELNESYNNGVQFIANHLIVITLISLFVF